MHTAPAVRVRGGDGLAWRCVQAGLPALAGAALLVWLLRHAGLAALPSALLACGSGALLAVGLYGLPPARARACELNWTGQRWTADGLPVQPQLMIDFGPWVLLRLRPDQRAWGTAPSVAPRWLALAASECGPFWPALRTALYGPPAQVSEAAASALAPPAGPPS